MLKIFIAFLLFLTIGFAFQSCNTDDPPPFTPKERELYSWSETRCLVDGKDWGDCNINARQQPSTNVSFWVWSYQLNIESLNYCADTPSSIYFTVLNFTGDTGIYTLNSNSVGGFVPRTFHPHLETTNNSTGVLHITEFDTTKGQQKLKATFNFVAANDTLNKKVSITNGSINTSKIKIE